MDLSTRFLSVDPIGRKYPELTPYQFASNTPIQAIDLDGLERFIVTVSQWNDSNGQTQQNVSTSFDSRDQELEREGVQINTYNIDTKRAATSFIEPVTITASKTKPFKEAAQENITTLLTKTRVIPAGQYIKATGSALQQAGFGESTEFRNSMAYGKISYERYSTNENNVGSRIKAEVGGRLDGSIQLNPFKGRSIFSPENYGVEQPSIEQRFYFHFNNEKPSSKEGVSVGLTWSLNSTTKIPLWGAGGLYFNYDAVSKKKEAGFYLNTNPSSFMEQNAGTLKGGMKVEFNSLPK